MADLFGSLAGLSTRPPSRWWSSVPFSIFVHAVVVLTAVIAPLAATGSLPTPSSMMVFSAPPPAPMPELPAPPRVVNASVAPVTTVPLDAPPVVAPERDVPTPTTSSSTASVGFDIPGGTGLPFLPSGSGVTLTPPVPPPVAPMRLTSNMRVPTKTTDVLPVYPSIARAAKVSGVVIIEAVIGVDGRVDDARVLRSVPMLDQAALAAVRQWRYTPTMLNGIAVPVVLTVTVNFTLK